MTTKLRAYFDGRVLVPEGPVDLPEGRILEIEASELEVQQQPRSALRMLAVIAEKSPAGKELPPDFASQHDHYLYGLPKRQ